MTAKPPAKFQIDMNVECPIAWVRDFVITHDNFLRVRDTDIGYNVNTVCIDNNRITILL